jgi:hypothetical protein
LSTGFKAQGVVNLIAAAIGSNLQCDGGQFVSEGDAINANGAKIDGNVVFQDVVVEGNVIFTYGYVANKFQWRSVNLREGMILDLRFTKVGTIWIDDQHSWPIREKLRIDGFVYDQLHDPYPATKVQLRKVQLDWLMRQPQGRFLSQPFEQLAGVLRKMGLEEDARAVMIAKNQEHARDVQWRPEWLWYGLFGHLIGYGYSPWRAFGISLIVIGIGGWLFRRGFRRGLITPTGEMKYTVERDGAHPSSTDYQKFNAFVYSLETFVPFLKLGMDEHWTPNANRNALGNGNRLRFPPKTGGWLRGYLWFHVIAGWVLTTLWVGGLTGLVKT